MPKADKKAQKVPSGLQHPAENMPLHGQERSSFGYSINNLQQSALSVVKKSRLTSLHLPTAIFHLRAPPPPRARQKRGDKNAKMRQNVTKRDMACGSGLGSSPWRGSWRLGGVKKAILPVPLVSRNRRNCLWWFHFAF